MLGDACGSELFKAHQLSRFEFKHVQIPLQRVKDLGEHHDVAVTLTQRRKICEIFPGQKRTEEGVQAVIVPQGVPAEHREAHLLEVIGIDFLRVRPRHSALIDPLELVQEEEITGEGGQQRRPVGFRHDLLVNGVHALVIIVRQGNQVGADYNAGIVTVFLANELRQL